MKEQTRERPEILAAAERKMHAWAMARELEDRADRRQAIVPTARPMLRFVAISREAGAGASEIGLGVGRRLGWEVFDQNLLDCIAERFHLPRMMLELVDETHANWVYDVLGTWMDRKLVPHEKFVSCLSHVVQEMTRRGNAVFVGRCAQFLLPRQETLVVRLVARVEYRIRQLAQRLGATEAQAWRKIRDLDSGRREFAQQFFHRDITDPHLYDLVINVERSGKDKAIDEIIAAVAPQGTCVLPR